MEHVLAAAALCICVYIVFLLLQKDKRSQVYFLAIAFFTLAWMLAYYSAAMSGFLRQLPLLFHTDLAASAFAGPAVYLFFFTVITEGKRPVRRPFAYFIMPIVLFAFIVAYNIAVNPIPGYAPGVPVQFSSPVLIALNFIPDAAFTTFYTAALIRGIRSRMRGEIRHVREFRVMMGFLIPLWFVSLFMLSAYPLRTEFVFVIAMILDAVIVTGFFLALARIPEYIFGRLPDVGIAHQPDAGQVAIPQAILLSPEETEIAMRRLEKLKQSEHFYSDPDIKLQTLAGRLGMTPNQLSFLLNSVMGVGFREYINGLRLERVEKDLRDKPHLTILQIAMDNGFASKTPFNSLFQKKFGMTPSEYRKKLRSGELNAED